MRCVFLIICLIFAIPGYSVTLRPDSPARYIVQPGDTLWSIANRYLKNPWEWKTLWHANPQVQNPAQLYPGAVIALRYRNQTPYLRVLSNGTIKLSPHIQATPLEDPVPPIPLEDIRPFLNGSLILDRDILENAPFVIAFHFERALAGQGDEIYVQNLCPTPPPQGKSYSYALYRRCGAYYEPGTRRFLGYKASLVAYAELVRGGNPATIMLTDIMQGVKLRDRVMPNKFPAFDSFFEPKTPSMPVNGRIIEITGDYTQGGIGLIGVINRGLDAGLQAGDVLGVYTRPRVVKNRLYRFRRWKNKCDQQCATIAPERIGEVMVFRVFSKTSFVLVVRSIQAITRLNIVTNP